MVDKNEPKMVPTDIEGHPLPTLTPEQYKRREELEYERLMKTSTKGIYNTWSREEKHLLITWAQTNNFETSLSVFKDIVEAFITFKPLGDNRVIRSMPKIDNSGREVDVICMYCARIHSITVPVGARGIWTVDAPCINSRKPESKLISINDEKFPIKKWETKWLEKEVKNG